MHDVLCQQLRGSHVRVKTQRPQFDSAPIGGGIKGYGSLTHTGKLIGIAYRACGSQKSQFRYLLLEIPGQTHYQEIPEPCLHSITSIHKPHNV